jgi:perosamine synthetase
MDPWLTIWAPLRPDIYLHRQGAEPYPLGEANCTLYKRGREALWHGLEALEIGEGHEIILPAYNHGSEVEVMRRRGIGLRFYDATDSLAPDEAELERLMGPDVRALYVIHGLGFGQDAPHWRRWCDERGILFIEDVAMAWLGGYAGKPLGSWGDLAYYSPWKTFGLPDSGALICRGGSPRAVKPAPFPLKSVLRAHFGWPLRRSRLLATLRGDTEGENEGTGLADFALEDPDAPAPEWTRSYCRRLDAEGVARKRRENFQYLLGELGDLVAPPYTSVHPESCPFAFPVLSEDPPGLVERLWGRRVRASAFWYTPHPGNDLARFPRAAQRRRSVVNLPVHQELREIDLERIVSAVRECTAGAALPSLRASTDEPQVA